MHEEKMGEAIPLVSICIPSYNSAQFIIDTIKSIEAQTYGNIEIIVVDDHSTDNTMDILNEYRENNGNERLSVYENAQNLGMAGNWNKCLELCKGEFIKIMGADDLLRADTIEYEVGILQKYPNAVLVSSDTQFVDVSGNLKGKYRRYRKSGMVRGEEAVRYSLYTRDYLGAPLANLFRREIYMKVGGFDPNMHYIVDYDFFLRMYMEGDVFILHESLNFFRIREDSNTGEVFGGSKGKLYVAEHHYMLRKHAELLNLSNFEIWASVQLRKMSNFVGSIYLKIKLGRIL